MSIANTSSPLHLISSVDVCNRALSHIGEIGITSFEDTTSVAKLCKTLYPISAQTALSKQPWTFALRTKELTLVEKVDKDILGNGLVFKFGLPRDFLRLINRGRHFDTHRIIGNEIFTAFPKAVLVYTANVDPSCFSSEFVSWFSLYFSIELGSALEIPSNKLDVLGRLERASYSSANIINDQGLNNNLSLRPSNPYGYFII